MFSHERVAALQRSLAAAREPSDAHVHEQAEAAKLETAWGASVLLAEVLAKSTIVPRLSEARAAQIVSPSILADLQSRSLVRVILGRLDLPWGVRMDLRKNGPLVGSGPENDALSALRAELEIVERADPMVDADLLMALRDCHAQVFTETPTMVALEGEGGVERVNQASFVLHLEATCWSPAMPRAAARLWKRVRATSAFKRLRGWLDIVSRSARWALAPTQMLQPDREEWLEAAIAAVLTEPDLLGWDREAARLRPERDDGVDTWSNRFAANPPDPELSTAERYRWWHDVYHADRDWHGGFECRRIVETLVFAIVCADSVDEGRYSDRGARIKQLILAGADRPFLSREVPEVVMRWRPEALAWLLVDPATAALAMNLILEMRSDFGLTFGTWEEHHERALARRQPLIDEAFTVFYEALGQIAASRPNDAARAVVEVLGPLSRRATAPSVMSHPHADARRREDVASLETGLRGVATAALPFTVRRRGATFYPAFLNTIGTELIAQLTSNTEESLSSVPVSPPMAVTRILLSLLRSFSADAEFSLRSDAPTSADVALEVARLHERSFIDTANRGYWTSDHASFAEQAWEDVAVELWGIKQLEALVKPVGLGRLLERLGSPEPTEIGGSEWNRRRSDRLAARLHLRILIHIHDELPGLESQARLHGADLGRFQAVVETGLTELLAAPGIGVLFEPEPLETDRIDLAVRVVHTLNRFHADRSAEAFRRWFDRLNHAPSLLAVASEIVSASVASRARERLLEIMGDGEEAIREIGWLPDLERVAQAAAIANEPELANRVLAYGERVTTGHRARSEWEESAFRTRLILAYHAHDLTQIESLPAPTIDKSRGGHLEGSRAFYRALTLLDADPSAAEGILSGLVDARPLEGGLLVNLFAAQLRTAAQLPERDRPRAFAGALERWSAAERILPPAERDRVRTQSEYNRLAALSGANLDAGFDAAWRRLAVDFRTRAEFVSLAVDHYRRRRRLTEAKEIAQLAWRYHASPDGSGPDDLDALVRSLERDTPGALGAALDLSPDARSLHATFLSFRNLSAENAARAIAGPGLELRDFVLGEIYEVLKGALLVRPVLEKIYHEDDYSDLSASMLRQRLFHFGWTVEPGSRGGKSGGECETARGGVGLRDYVLSCRGEVAVVEAMRLPSVKKREIREHLQKLPGYDATGNAQAYVVVYYMGHSFDRFVDKYRAFVATLEIGGLKRVSFGAYDAPGVSTHVANIRVCRGEYELEGVRVTHDHLIVRVAPDHPAASSESSADEEEEHNSS